MDSVRIGVLGLVAGLVLSGTTFPAAAHVNSSAHTTGIYPQRGFHWLDDLNHSRYNNLLTVASTSCNDGEAAAWDSFDAMLVGGQTAFRGAWSAGITMYPWDCPTSVNARMIDIKLIYLSNTAWGQLHDWTGGGHHHYVAASAAYCASWSKTHPCGIRSSIHIRLTNYNSYSSAYKAKFLIHETGHSMGQADSCAHTGLGNNGVDCTMNGTYVTDDKKILRDITYSVSESSTIE